MIKKDAQFYLLGPNIEKVSTELLDNIKYRFIKTDYKTVVSERHMVRMKIGEDSISLLIELSSGFAEPTLIFCQSPASVNKVASAFLRSGKFPSTQNNEELSHWLKDNYHSEWILPNCLEYGIGGKNAQNAPLATEEIDPLKLDVKNSVKLWSKIGV